MRKVRARGRWSVGTESTLTFPTFIFRTTTPRASAVCVLILRFPCREPLNQWTEISSRRRCMLLKNAVICGTVFLSPAAFVSSSFFPLGFPTRLRNAWGCWYVSYFWVCQSPKQKNTPRVTIYLMEMCPHCLKTQNISRVNFATAINFEFLSNASDDVFTMAFSISCRIEIPYLGHSL